jgi:hypothetical protein
MPQNILNNQPQPHSHGLQHTKIIPGKRIRAGTIQREHGNHAGSPV